MNCVADRWWRGQKFQTHIPKSIKGLERLCQFRPLLLPRLDVTTGQKVSAAPIPVPSPKHLT
jgi:hypothetical protein